MVTATTLGVKISVDTAYQDDDSNPTNEQFIFAYRITIENKTDYTLQLMRRQWLIFDSNGVIREVDGEGVIGKQPVLQPGDNFTYVSGCKLKTDMGTMSGHYLMKNLMDDSDFIVEIPRFELVSPFRLN